MQAYLIDAAARRITPITYTHAGFRAWLPGGICIAHVFDNRDVLYVDDEALNRRATRAFRIRARPDGQPMMSDGILTGRDHGDSTLDPDMTMGQLEAAIEWLTVDQALDWFRAKAGTPAVTQRRGAAPPVVLATWSQYLANLEGRPGGYRMADDERLFR